MRGDPSDATRDRLRGRANRRAAEQSANEDVVVENARRLDPADQSAAAQQIRETAEDIGDRRTNRGD